MPQDLDGRGRVDLRDSSNAAERRLSWIIAGVITVVYIFTCDRFLMGGDNGEFATLFATGGVAHPPGYPLYVLYLRLMRWLPGANPAHAAAVATALLAGLAALLLQVACVAWGSTRHAAVLVTVAFAFQPMTWRLATHAEVFVLHAAIAGAALWVSAPRGPFIGKRRCVAVSALLGLGLSNQHTIILLGPVLVWGLRSGWREERQRVPCVFMSLSALAAGLSPYLYLPIAAHGDPSATWIWGDWTSLAGIQHHLRRGDYGTFRLAGAGSGREPVRQLWAVLVAFARYLAPLMVTSTLAMVVHGILSRRSTARTEPGSACNVSVDGVAAGRVAAVVLGSTLLISGPLFVALFNVSLDNVGAEVVERFYVLPLVVMSVLAARWIDGPLRAIGPGRGPRVALTSVLAAVVVLPSALSLKRERTDALLEYARDTLGGVEQRALVLLAGDQRLFACLYLQVALGERRDIVLVAEDLLGAPWYQKRLAERFSWKLPETRSKMQMVSELVRIAYRERRALYRTRDVALDRSESVRRYPHGTLIRVLPKVAGLPSVDETRALNETWLASARQRVPLLTIHPSSWMRNLWDDYARPWRILERWYRDRGETLKAKEMAERRRTLVAP
jgi:hypothetical protein